MSEEVNRHGDGGIEQAKSKPVMFKVKNTRDKGKLAFACAFGKKCLNRCPRLRAKMLCQFRRGKCNDSCGGLADIQ